MRDAFGGIFMIRLLLVFIFIYVMFTSIALNYAKAFRIKNSVISFIEEREIIEIDSNTQTIKLSNETKDDLAKLLAKANYNIKCKTDGVYTDDKGNNKYCFNGVIINYTGKTDRTLHYEVTTFTYWSIDMLKPLFNLNGDNPESKVVDKGGWKITGIANVIKRS